MKFCKVLENQEKNFPELNHMFLRYKALKKKIKAIPLPAHIDTDDVGDHEGPSAAVAEEGISASGYNRLSPEEQAFIAALNEDLKMFNDFFMEKEEDAVIKIQAMSDQLQQASSSEHLKEMKERLINFHGELVLILHWSLINYSAVVKILKKHDKRTGLLLRAPYIANVLKQPFASTNVMSRLVKRAEELVARAGEPSTQSTATEVAVEEARQHVQQQLLDCSDDEGSSLTEVCEHKSAPRMPNSRTELVLEMWESLAKSASTPSTILRMEAGPQVAQGVLRHPCTEYEQAGSPMSHPRWSEQGSGQSVNVPCPKRARYAEQE